MIAVNSFCFQFLYIYLILFYLARGTRAMSKYAQARLKVWTGELERAEKIFASNISRLRSIIVKYVFVVFALFLVFIFFCVSVFLAVFCFVLFCIIF
jgi:hypothetical protein